MSRVSTMFSDSDRKRIAQAVAQAESRTSAEIVPVVAAASGRYDRAEDMVGLWLGLVLMVVTWALLPASVFPSVSDAGAWGGTPTVLSIVAIVAAMVVGFIIGAIAATRIGWLRRLFTPRKQMADEVEAKARAVFFDGRVHHTRQATGVLIFVSLFERRAAALADKQVVEAIGDEALRTLCDQLTAALAKGQPTDALCAAIAAAGERLGATLPIEAGDVNELEDALVVME